jgi:hypothetical protein
LGLSSNTAKTMLIVIKNKSIDEKWDEVQKHYEPAYRVRFKRRPNDKVIEDLWLNIQKLHQSKEDYDSSKK